MVEGCCSTLTFTIRRCASTPLLRRRISTCVCHRQRAAFDGGARALTTAIAYISHLERCSGPVAGDGVARLSVEQRREIQG